MSALKSAKEEAQDAATRTDRDLQSEGAKAMVLQNEVIKSEGMARARCSNIDALFQGSRLCDSCRTLSQA